MDDKEELSAWMARQVHRFSPLEVLLRHTPRQIIVVGLDNPHSSRADDALLPCPAHSAGWYLPRRLGISEALYMDRFRRYNLIPAGHAARSFDAEEKRCLAQRLYDELGGHDPIELVLLGREVAEAFAVVDLAVKSFYSVLRQPRRYSASDMMIYWTGSTYRYTTRAGVVWKQSTPSPAGTGIDHRSLMVSIPHPSGAARVWNNPNTADRARQAVAELCWQAIYEHRDPYHVVIETIL